MTSADIPSFDELVDVLRQRLHDDEALNPSGTQTFKSLMKHEAEAGMIADNFYHEAFDELEALGHLNPAASGKTSGDAFGRLSADGRLYLREHGERN